MLVDIVKEVKKAFYNKVSLDLVTIAEINLVSIIILE